MGKWAMSLQEHVQQQKVYILQLNTGSHFVARFVQLTISLSCCVQEHEKLLSKLQKQKQQLEEQHQELEELGGMLFSPMNAAHKFTIYEDAWGKDVPSPHQYKFPSSFGGMKTGGLFGGKAPSQAASMKTNTNPVPQTRTSFQV